VPYGPAGEVGSARGDSDTNGGYALVTPLDYLPLAIRAAKAGGALLRGRGEEGLVVVSDAGRDVKLEADRRAEARIVETLRGESDLPVLSEECGPLGLLGEGPFWVIDPLDGTFNFQRGIPFCCVAVGLMLGEEPLVGVIYDFDREELFTAVQGGGAWLDERPIRVSAVGEPRRAVLSTGWPTHGDFSDAGLSRLLRRIQRFKKVRMLGSAALSMAYVACGRLDAYAENGAMLWDVAAGAAIVRAAGGHVSWTAPGPQPWVRDICCLSRSTLAEGLIEAAPHA